MSRTIIAIALASIAFSLWGYVWYATVFDDIWQILIGRSEAELIDLAIARGPIQDVFVLLISIPQVIVIYLALMWAQARTFIQYISLSVVLSTLLVLPSIGNTTLFVGTPLLLLALDYGYFFFGYAGIALVFFIVAPPRKMFSNKQNTHGNSEFQQNHPVKI